jgi:hypothetical protein
VLNCEQHQQLASGFIDGEIRADEIETLQGHLESCEECRTFLDSAYRVRDLLKANDGKGDFGPAPEGFAAGVSALIAREKIVVASAPSRRVSPLFGRVTAAAAAAVLIVSVGWSWLSLSESSEPLLAVHEDTAPIADEGSMASYLSKHAMQSMDSTFLGSGEGIELASFEVLGQDFD